MALPSIIISFYWDDPKKLACVIVFSNGTKPEVESFISILKNRVAKEQIFGVPRLISEIESIAEHAFTLTVRCYDESTIFMNEVV